MGISISSLLKRIIPYLDNKLSILNSSFTSDNTSIKAPSFAVVEVHVDKAEKDYRLKIIAR